MTECRIICHHVPFGPPYYASGQMTLSCRCETHGMEVASQGMPADYLCPIGHIEKTVKDEIARIIEALEANREKP